MTTTSLQKTDRTETFTKQYETFRKAVTWLNTNPHTERDLADFKRLEAKLNYQWNQLTPKEQDDTLASFIAEGIWSSEVETLKSLFGGRVSKVSVTSCRH